SRSVGGSEATGALNPPEERNAPRFQRDSALSRPWPPPRARRGNARAARSCCLPCSCLPIGHVARYLRLTDRLDAQYDCRKSVMISVFRKSKWHECSYGCGLAEGRMLGMSSLKWAVAGALAALTFG